MFFVAFTMHMSYLPPGPHVFGCGSSHPNFGAKGKSSRVVNQTNKGTTVVRYFLDNRVTSVWLVCFHRRWGSNHPLGTPQGSFSSACFGLQTRTTPTAKARKAGELDHGHCRFLALWPYDFRNPETLICDDMWLKWFTDQNWDGFRFGIHKTSHKMALIGTQMTICGTYIGTYIGTQMTLLFINVHQYERIPRFQKRYPFWGWRSNFGHNWDDHMLWLWMKNIGQKATGWLAALVRVTNLKLRFSRILG